MAIEGRLAKLRSKLAEQRLDAILITMMDNVRYISGFTGSTATAIVGKSDAVLLVDPRYTTQANDECRGFRIVEYRRVTERLPRVIAEVEGMKAGSLGFEADYLPYSEYKSLEESRRSNISLVDTQRIVDDLRLIKDAQELDAIKYAIAISDACFEEILVQIKPGLMERDVAIAIDFCMRKHGASKPAFDTIVAAGPHAALPHAQPGDRILERGQLLKMDFGAEYQQYPSDLTRTVCLGQPDAKQREVYNTVLEAQLKAIDAIRPGIAGKDVDSVARDHIAAAGYGKYFGHGLGHSLGRGVHDGPGLSQTSPIILEPGMVMTVEPGIYIPGWGGVRIEDDVLVTDDGCEILTKATKELLAL